MLYRPGSMNTAKQVLVNSLLKEYNYHVCHDRRRLDFRCRSTLRTDDTLIWLNNDGFFRLNQIEPTHGKEALGNRLNVNPYSTDDIGLHLPWKHVGVFKVGKVSPRSSAIDLMDVRGKAVMLVGDVIASYPRKWMVK